MAQTSDLNTTNTPVLERDFSSTQQGTSLLKSIIPTGATHGPTQERCLIIDNSTSATLTLPDGRKLGYAQYGSPTGKAVIYLHRHPGSRLDAATRHEIALQLGARIISPDRPGFGWSSPAPRQTLRDYPKDIEHLAEHLGLEAYSILAASGGGVYALACARFLPAEKLKCVSMVCAFGGRESNLKGRGLSGRYVTSVGYRLSPFAPVTRYWWANDEKVQRLSLSENERLKLKLQDIFKGKEVSTGELRAFLEKNEASIRLNLRNEAEAFAQGFDGLMHDGKLMTSKLGFKVEDIRPDLPFQLWYGIRDKYATVEHGEKLAARLGDRAHLEVKINSHYSLFDTWQCEILKYLLSRT